MPLDIAALVASRIVNTRVWSTFAEAAPSVAAGLPIVGTHDGSFHCDEAMACGILHFTKQFQQMAVLRSRVPDDLRQCTAVVDVGAVYAADQLRLDHHQAEFQDTMTTPLKTYRTRLSSAGLVYRHFGREIIADLGAKLHEDGAIEAPLSDSQLDVAFDQIYKNFVEHVDGIDNGVEEFSSTSREVPLVRNYKVSSTLSARVAALHGRWNRPQDKAADNAQFNKAMILCATEFFEAAEYVIACWLPARTLVEKSFHDRFNLDPSGRIITLSAGGCPWKEHLTDIEASNNADGAILYVVFPDDRGGGRVQCVPKKDSSFQNRKSLPWRGLRDNDLTQASGIDGGVFVHVSGFIGGNKTFDGAIAMARKAVEAPEEETK